MRADQRDQEIPAARGSEGNEEALYQGDGLKTCTSACRC